LLDGLGESEFWERGKVGERLTSSRNEMEINFSEELRGEIERWGGDLRVQSRYLSDKEVQDTYLKGKFGNAYDFDQQDRLDIEF